jgi:hypothetical protein
LADHQNVLEMNLFGVWRGRYGRIHSRILGEGEDRQG